MKKYRIVAVFVMILLMGCGSAQNGKMKESSTMKESEETISIKTYDWNHARIVLLFKIKTIFFIRRMDIRWLA